MAKALIGYRSSDLRDPRQAIEHREELSETAPLQEMQPV